MGVVIDSSIFIAAERGRLDWLGFHGTLGSKPLFLTSVTLAELAHGVERADTLERRTKRKTFVDQVESQYPLLTFGRAEALQYAKLWAEFAKVGTLIGTHDQMIAAIARTHDHSVATLNLCDFSRVPCLVVIDATPFLLTSLRHGQGG